MNEDLDAMLREHYRRTAENIQPDADLIGRCRNVPRPAKAVPRWVFVLPAAAVVAAVAALFAWAFLHPGPAAHPVAPAVPPPATTLVPSPVPSGPIPRGPMRHNNTARPSPPARTPSSIPRPAQRTTPSASPSPTARP